VTPEDFPEFSSKKQKICVDLETQDLGFSLFKKCLPSRNSSKGMFSLEGLARDFLQKNSTPQNENLEAHRAEGDVKTLWELSQILLKKKSTDCLRFLSYFQQVKEI
jgi:hypothetical protein